MPVINCQLSTINCPLLYSSLSRGCFCLLAKWQVSWLLPGSASSQGEAPVTFGALHAEGNYSSGHCSGIAPDSLSTLTSLQRLGYHQMRCKVTTISEKLQKKRQKNRHALNMSVPFWCYDAVFYFKLVSCFETHQVTLPLLLPTVQVALRRRASCGSGW